MERSSQLTTQQLLTFLRIIQTGSFSDAALVLDVAQPTISGRIRSLEKAVGGALFVRRGRGITLTPRGEAFRAYAERALAVLDEGLLAANLDSAGLVGRITLGVSDSSLVDSFLGAAIARFHDAHPAVDIDINMSSCGSLVRSLHDGLLKLAVLSWPYASPSFDSLVPLLRFRERLQVATSPHHPLAQRAELTFEEVGHGSEPLFDLWWNQPSRRALDATRKLPVAALEVPVQVARHTLLQGRGAALFAPSVISHELAAGTLVLLNVTDLPPIFSESALVRHEAGGEPPPPTQAFISELRSAAADLCVPG